MKRLEEVEEAEEASQNKSGSVRMPAKGKDYVVLPTSDQVLKKLIFTQIEKKKNKNCARD